MNYNLIAIKHKTITFDIRLFTGIPKTTIKIS